MTCAGCAATVQQRLNTVEGVKNVVVNLEKGEVVVKKTHRATISVIKGIQGASPERHDPSRTTCARNGLFCTCRKNAGTARFRAKLCLAGVKPLTDVDIPPAGEAFPLRLTETGPTDFAPILDEAGLLDVPGVGVAVLDLARVGDDVEFHRVGFSCGARGMRRLGWPSALPGARASSGSG